MLSFGLATQQILDTFTEEIVARGGTVRDVWDDGMRLFARSLLPQHENVQPKDRVDGGVALRTTADGVCVHPYTFRQVCTNGMIMSETIASRRIEAREFATPEAILQATREATASCCAPEIFQTSIRDMRTALEREADLVLMLMPIIQHLQDAGAIEQMLAVVDQFHGERDRSRFGLANVVTAVARDTDDPDVRWRMEELGGGVLIGVPPRPSRDGGHSWVKSREEVTWGRAPELRDVFAGVED